MSPTSFGGAPLTWERALALEHAGAWAAWLTPAEHAALRPALASAGAWAAFVRPAAGATAAGGVLQLRCRALLFDPAPLPPAWAVAERPAVCRPRLDDVYYSLEHDADALAAAARDGWPEQVVSAGEAPVAADAGESTGEAGLPARKDAARPGEGRGASRASCELSALLPNVRPSKRWTNATSDHHARLCDALDKVLESLKAQTFFSEPFLTKVAKSLAPNYYTIITHPMDLGTMSRKLKACKYTTKAEFEADIDLIVQNCRTYNEPASFYVKMANQLGREAAALLKALPDVDARPTQMMDTDVSLSLTPTGGDSSEGVLGLLTSAPSLGHVPLQTDSENWAPHETTIGNVSQQDLPMLDNCPNLLEAEITGALPPSPGIIEGDCADITAADGARRDVPAPSKGGVARSAAGHAVKEEPRQFNASPVAGVPKVELDEAQTAACAEAVRSTETADGNVRCGEADDGDAGAGASAGEGSDAADGLKKEAREETVEPPAGAGSTAEQDTGVGGTRAGGGDAGGGTRDVLLESWVKVTSEKRMRRLYQRMKEREMPFEQRPALLRTPQAMSEYLDAAGRAEQRMHGSGEGDLFFPEVDHPVGCVPQLPFCTLGNADDSAADANEEAAMVPSLLAETLPVSSTSAAVLLRAGIGRTLEQVGYHCAHESAVDVFADAVTTYVSRLGEAYRGLLDSQRDKVPSSVLLRQVVESTGTTATQSLRAFALSGVLERRAKQRAIRRQQVLQNALDAAHLARGIKQTQASKAAAKAGTAAAKKQSGAARAAAPKAVKAKAPKKTAASRAADVDFDTGDGMHTTMDGMAWQQVGLGETFAASGLVMPGGVTTEGALGVIPAGRGGKPKTPKAPAAKKPTTPKAGRGAGRGAMAGIQMQAPGLQVPNAAGMLTYGAAAGMSAAVQGRGRGFGSPAAPKAAGRGRGEVLPPVTMAIPGSLAPGSDMLDPAIFAMPTSFSTAPAAMQALHLQQQAAAAAVQGRGRGSVKRPADGARPTVQQNAAKKAKAAPAPGVAPPQSLVDTEAHMLVSTGLQALGSAEGLLVDPGATQQQTLAHGSLLLNSPGAQGQLQRPTG